MLVFISMGGAEGVYSTAPTKEDACPQGCALPFGVIQAQVGLETGMPLCQLALLGALAARWCHISSHLHSCQPLLRENSKKFCRGAGRRMWWTLLGWAHIQTCMDTQKRAGIQMEFFPAGSSYALGNAASIWTVATKWTNSTGWAGITAVLRCTTPQKQARTMT